MAKKQLNILTKLKYYIQYMRSLGFDQRAYTQFQGYDLNHFSNMPKFMIVRIQMVCEFTV